MKKKIYWGYYIFDTEKSTVTRNKSSRGTRVGYILKPYKSNPYTQEEYLNLYINARRYNVSLSKLHKKYG